MKLDAALIGIIMMPFTYGFIGWLTNVVALKMTFYPLNFWGIPPYLGWQGIVPRKSKALALKSVNMITERLIKLDEFFSKVDPDQLEAEFQPVLSDKIPSITDRIIEALPEDIRSQLSGDHREKILKRAEHESGHTVKHIATQMRDNISSIFNFKNFVLKSLTGPNVKRIVDIFQEVGSHEFKFIEKSGLFFGAILGTGQAVLWHFFPIWYTLPIQGVIVGYITNWLALVMIFRPLYEKRFLFFKYHGLFLKRQDEVSQKYCRMFGNDILTPRNLMEEILYRRASRTVYDSVVKSISEEMHEMHLEGDTNLESIDDIKKDIINEAINDMSKASAKLEKYMGRALNVERNMYSRMSKLPPEEFEPILRSAFQEDEYILILIGAVLVAFVGLGQAIYMLTIG